MSINWRNINEIKPDDDQECVTRMKHGIISGCYSAADNEFRGYYWHDMTWHATHWAPLAEVTP